MSSSLASTRERRSPVSIAGSEMRPAFQCLPAPGLGATAEVGTSWSTRGVSPSPRAAAAGLLLALFSCGRPDPQARSPAGLWVWHEEWVSAPEEIVEEFGPQWNASGALVRFCPDGRFRMATGILYRAGGTYGLGASDGLTLYDGRWLAVENGVEVRYKLTEAEIQFRGYEQARAREIVERLAIGGSTLRFTYHRPPDDRRFELLFESAATAPERTTARFVECAPPSVGSR